MTSTNRMTLLHFGSNDWFTGIGIFHHNQFIKMHRKKAQSVTILSSQICGGAAQQLLRFGKSPGCLITSDEIDL